MVPVARHYVVQATPGQAETLEAELARLVDYVRAVPGSLSFDLLRDVEADHRFLFIEKWESVAAHQGAARHIPKEAFGAFMAALDKPLSGSYFEYLKTV